MVRWKVSLNRFPWNPRVKKKTGPDFSEARSLHGARGTSARAAICDSFHFLEGWFDVRDLGAVLGFDSHAGSPSLRSVIAEATQRPSQQEPSSAARSRDSGTGSAPAAGISVRHVLKEVVTTAPRRPLTNISSRSEGFRYLRTGCLSGTPLDG
jgi:hypothetical protein